MGKALKIALISVGIVVLLLVGAVAFAYMAIAKSPTVQAQLHIESGDVMVNGIPATSDMALEEEDVVETGSDGKATIILHESVIITLDSSTRVQISDLARKHPKVEQSSGETWNQFTKFSGVEGYSISYGDSVASVRGTAFSLSEGKLMTAEGTVEYILEGKNYTVTENEVVEKTEKEVKERKANSAEIAKMEEKSVDTIKHLKLLRDKEIEKNSKAYGLIKEKTGLSDEDVKNALDDADNGKLDLREVAGKSPIKIEAAEKIIQITEKIKELNKTVAAKAVEKEVKIAEEKTERKNDANSEKISSSKSDVKKNSITGSAVVETLDLSMNTAGSSSNGNANKKSTSNDVVKKAAAVISATTNRPRDSSDSGKESSSSSSNSGSSGSKGKGSSSKSSSSSGGGKGSSGGGSGGSSGGGSRGGGNGGKK